MIVCYLHFRVFNFGSHSVLVGRNCFINHTVQPGISGAGRWLRDYCGGGTILGGSE